MKKVHIFHISEFGGHSKAAHNVKEALNFKHPEIKVTTFNGLGYFYPHGEKIIDFFYIGIIKHAPHLWGSVYDRQEVVKALSPYRKLIHRFTFGKLNRLIEQDKPDCFVATQAFPCGLIADFKEQYGLQTPLVGIVTDYHPHRFWVHPFVDRYVVACQQAKEFLIQSGIDEKKIHILGIPISVRFLWPYPRQEISNNFGFDTDSCTVLIMGGGLGIGPIRTIAKCLDRLPYKLQIIVVCGKNLGLYKWFLKNKQNFKKPVFAFGYIDFINKIMDFADIIITKGGGITISEALAKGLCIVVTNPIPGQEEKNVQYLLEKEAIIRADKANAIGEVIDVILGNPKKMYALRESAKRNSIIDSSLRIVDLVLELIS